MVVKVQAPKTGSLARELTSWEVVLGHKVDPWGPKLTTEDSLDHRRRLLAQAHTVLRRFVRRPLVALSV